jgi:hypothetical protein
MKITKNNYRKVTPRELGGMIARNGKGDKPRPVDKKVWDENYEAIFGKKEEKEKEE